MSAPQTVTKTFGSGTREVPVPSQRASKWYPTEDTPIPKKARKTQRPTTLRPSLQPGAVLIILAGRYRGKRVVYLKPLTGGVLLVSGPFKINGVPIRRVNARYVIATSTKVDISGVDVSKFDDAYFAREKEAKKSDKEAFFDAAAPKEKKPLPESRAADQKAVDKALIVSIKRVPYLSAYLASSFSLSKGDRPHLMKW
ncbi:ribosomal protein L6e-domain-containing protein [Kalaharituber pfeilii]|nr:ribosomal protein L6e-domain-containing protein [Kalaharituber pfeilii]